MKPGSEDIRQHSGKKYLRRVFSAVEPKTFVEADVYAVIKAYRITCPARQHALKKLLCAGDRGKGDAEKDLREAVDALYRAIQLANEGE